MEMELEKIDVRVKVDGLSEAAKKGHVGQSCAASRTKGTYGRGEQGCTKPATGDNFVS